MPPSVALDDAGVVDVDALVFAVEIVLVVTGTCRFSGCGRVHGL